MKKVIRLCTLMAALLCILSAGCTIKDTPEQDALLRQVIAYIQAEDADGLRQCFLEPDTFDFDAFIPQFNQHFKGEVTGLEKYKYFQNVKYGSGEPVVREDIHYTVTTDEGVYDILARFYHSPSTGLLMRSLQLQIQPDDA